MVPALTARTAALLLALASVSSFGCATWSDGAYRRSLPAPDRWLDVDGTRIAIDIHEPQGPPKAVVVALHGDPTAGEWDAVAALCQEAGLRFVHFERPGWRRSEGRPEASSGVRRVLAAVVTSEREQGVPTLVVAYSDGAVPLLVDDAWPEDLGVDGVLLVAPRTGRFGDGIPTTGRALRWWVVAVLFDLVPTPVIRAVARADMARALQPVDLDDERVVAFVDEVARAASGRGLHRAMWMETEHFLEDLDGFDRRARDAAAVLAFERPLAALFASEDALLDPALHRPRLERLAPHAVIECVEGAGHALPMTHPAAVRDALLRLLARVQLCGA